MSESEGGTERRMPSSATYALTGGTGFLGMHVASELLRKGYSVRALARDPTAPAAVSLSNQGVAIVKGGLTDADSLSKLCDGADGVFHLAGTVVHSRSAEAVAKSEEANVKGVRDVVVAASRRCKKACGSRCNRPRIVYASTSGVAAVTTDGNAAPTTEHASEYADDVVAGWPYYETKIRAERVAREIADQEMVELICMRPSLLLGPGDARLSSCRSILDLVEGRVPFVPGGGVAFVDVRDCAAAFVSAMERRDRTATGRENKDDGGVLDAYFLSAANWPMKQYFGEVCAQAGVKPPWLEVPTPAAWAMAATAHGVGGLFG